MNQRQKEELLKEIRDLRAALDTHKTQQDGSVNSPERQLLTPRLNSNTTTTALACTSASCSPSGHSIISSPFHRVSWQHPDMEIREVGPQHHSTLLQMSHGCPDRYGCLLFRFVTPEEKYWAWCVTTNWHGSRGKWELPGNLKEFLVNTLRQKFSDMAARDEMMLVDRISEVLRQPHQFPMRLIR